MKTRQALLLELAHIQTYIARLFEEGDHAAKMVNLSFAGAYWEKLDPAITAQLERVAPEEPEETLARVERWVNAYLTPATRHALRRTLAQRRYAAKQKLKTIQLSKATHARLAAYAAKEGLTLDKAIDQLLSEVTTTT